MHFVFVVPVTFPDTPWVYALGKRAPLTCAVGRFVAPLLDGRIYVALKVEIHRRMAVPQAIVP